jgi:hypothetical protein
MGFTAVTWLRSACVLLALQGTADMVLASVRPAPSEAAGAYDFAYRLSGDRRVAPVQVFDDGRTTWLQFQPGQTLPAVFVAGPTEASAGQLASYTQQGPYLVLNGTANAFVLRIGAITARADYTGNAQRAGLPAAAPGMPSQWAGDTTSPAFPNMQAASASATAAPTAQAASSYASGALSAPASAGMASLPTASRLAQQLTHAPPAYGPAAGAVSQEASVLEFDVSLSDKNMRTALGRWARQAGWTFHAEHWAADVDIPLSGVAAFGADFRHAVRTLLSSTELAERPLQPCFYSNRVLRVVPLAQACDRTIAPGSPGVGKS